MEFKQKNDDENIIDLGIFDESLLTDNSKDTSAINPGSNRMKGQTPSSTAAYSPACPSRSMLSSSFFMSVSNPEEFPKRSQVNCKDSSVTETPGAKHRMLKEDLMEKMKGSKEQKFQRQKEMETMDNEEEADSFPDSEVENANADCPVEEPIDQLYNRLWRRQSKILKNLRSLFSSEEEMEVETSISDSKEVLKDHDAVDEKHPVLEVHTIESSDSEEVCPDKLKCQKEKEEGDDEIIFIEEVITIMD